MEVLRKVTLEVKPSPNHAEKTLKNIKRPAFLLPWAGLEQTSKNTGFDGTADAGGLPGGLSPEALARFCDELQAAGFTPEQFRAIKTAMQAAGVAMVETEVGV